MSFAFSPLRASDSLTRSKSCPTWSEDGPRGQQEGSKTAPGHFKRASKTATAAQDDLQDGPKAPLRRPRHPRESKMAPRCLQDGPRKTQDGRRWPQDGHGGGGKLIDYHYVFNVCWRSRHFGIPTASKSQKAHKMTTSRPRRLPKCPNTAPDGPKMASKIAKLAQDGHQDGPKTPPRRAR